MRFFSPRKGLVGTVINRVFISQKPKAKKPKAKWSQSQKPEAKRQKPSEAKVKPSAANNKEKLPQTEKQKTKNS